MKESRPGRLAMLFRMKAEWLGALAHGYLDLRFTSFDLNHMAVALLSEDSPSLCRSSGLALGAVVVVDTAEVVLLHVMLCQWMMAQTNG